MYSMECQECNKRLATLYFTRIINGQLIEVRTCEHCAQKYYGHAPSEQQVSFHDFLKEFFEYKESTSFQQTDTQHKKEVYCSNCQLSFSQFRSKGKFGCYQCYDSFRLYLPSLLRSVHNGSIHHCGKVPSKKRTSMERVQKIGELREDLQQCIANEHFEEAAIIRDKIYALENNTHLRDGEI